MCLNPIQRKNPYYNPEFRSSSPRYQSGIHRVGLSFCKPDSEYMLVPCNVCPSCIALRQNDLTQRAQVEARYSFVWMLTLTFDDKHLPVTRVPLPGVPFDSDILDIPSVPSFSYDFDSVELDPVLCPVDDLPLSDAEIVASREAAYAAAREFHKKFKERKSSRFDGSSLSCSSASMPYADHTLLQVAIRHFREYISVTPELSSRNFKYLAVSELGGRKGRPHFHMLIFLEHRPDDFLVGLRSYRSVSSDLIKPSVASRLTKLVSDWWRVNWATNVGSRKNPVWEPLYTYVVKPDPSSRSGFKSTFDCHLVQNEKTDSGFLDVAFYVSKYIMKVSDREIKRKVFLQNALDEATFSKFWQLVRSRMMLSKGFGVHSETVVNESGRHCIQPDPSVISELSSNVRLDAGKSPGPIFVADSGVHRPLARYYFDKHDSSGNYVLTPSDIRYIFERFDRDSYVPSYERGSDFISRKRSEFSRRRSLMESHEIL